MAACKNPAEANENIISNVIMITTHFPKRDDIVRSKNDSVPTGKIWAGQCGRNGDREYQPVAV
jgi:hypothetical protein